ncbi:hypothetical protein D3C75_927570 [compost metagenome]
MHARPGEVIDAQQDFTGLLIQTRILVFKFAPDHHFDKRIFGQRHHFTLGNKLPIAEHGHVVANLEDFLHTVRDINDAAPLSFQLADHAE